MDLIVGLFFGYVLVCFLTARHGGGESLAQFFSLFHATSEVDAERRRAAGGVGFLVIAAMILYIAAGGLGVDFWLSSWRGAMTAIGALIHGSPADLPASVTVPAAADALVVVLIVAGIFRLLVGWNRSRGPRDMIAGTKALFMVVASAALLIGSHYGAYWAYLHHHWDYATTVNPWLPAFYVWLLAKGVTRLFLSVRGPGGGNARKLVERDIRQSAFAWRPARRTQF